MRVLLITIPNPPLACPAKNKTEREGGEQSGEINQALARFPTLYLVWGNNRKERTEKKGTRTCLAFELRWRKM